MTERFNAVIFDGASFWDFADAMPLGARRCTHREDGSVALTRQAGGYHRKERPSRVAARGRDW